MAFHLASIPRTAGVNGITTLFNKGSNPTDSTLVIYSNDTSQPGTPENSVPGGSVILATAVFPDTAFANAVTGTGVANGLPLLANVVHSGTPGWFRFFDGASFPNPLGDGTCTITGSGGDMTFDNITFASGGVVRITNLSLALPM